MKNLLFRSPSYFNLQKNCQAALREMCSAHKENLPTLLKCTIFNELSNARNHNNMAMLYVMFTADPVLAPASLAAVFLELLMQKECYLVRTAQFFPLTIC